MSSDFSRRNFLAAGLVAPVAAAQASGSQAGAPPDAPSDSKARIAYRTLGNTGLKVSSVGFGCMITSDPTVITRAADMGITYFDTSRWYQKGNNERMVGAALGSKRKSIVLSTKVDALTKEGALNELEMSLRELGTDYLDIWYLHGKDNPDAIKDELIEAQEIARQQGKVRFIGMSTHRLANVSEKILAGKKMQVVLAAYNFTMDEPMEKALASLHEAGVGLVAMKVMAGGARGKNPKPQMQRPGAAAAALKWVLKNPAIATTVPSMTDNDQLEENFKVMSQGFSGDDKQILTARLEEIRPDYCRMCGKCDGKCPLGLPVSDVLRYAMYAEGYGQFALGRERFLEMPEHLQQVRCGDCESCPIQCPNGVRVRERLVRAQEWFA